MCTTIMFYTVPAHLDAANSLITKLPDPYCNIPVAANSEHVVISNILRDCADEVASATLILAWTIEVTPDEIPQDLLMHMQSSDNAKLYSDLMSGGQIGGTAFLPSMELTPHVISNIVHQIDSDTHRAYSDLLTKGFEVIGLVASEVDLSKEALDSIINDVRDTLIDIVPDIGMIAKINESECRAPAVVSNRLQ